jgi:hypothetical protein
MLTNNRLRRTEEACQKKYFMDPDAAPFLNTTTFPTLVGFERVIGAMVGVDAATGYLKGSWQYTTVAAFIAEFVGFLDNALEPQDADCNAIARSCGVMVYSGCGLVVEAALDSATAMLPTYTVEPWVDTSGAADYVHPFIVTQGAAGSANAVGTVTKIDPAVTAATIVSFNGI